MRQIRFEIHISSKQYLSDISITGSHFLKNFFFTGGCPTVPVSNVSLSLSWACDPYIGEQIILNKFIVMMMLFWNSITPLCRPVDLRQLLRSYKCCLRSSHNTGIKNTEWLYLWWTCIVFFSSLFMMLAVIIVSLSIPSKLYFAHPKPVKVYCWTQGAGRSAWSRQVHKLFWPPSPLPGAPSYCQPAMVIISFYSLMRRKKK